MFTPGRRHPQNLRQPGRLRSHLVVPDGQGLAPVPAGQAADVHLQRVRPAAQGILHKFQAVIRPAVRPCVSGNKRFHNASPFSHDFRELL